MELIPLTLTKGIIATIAKNNKIATYIVSLKLMLQLTNVNISYVNYLTTTF